MMRIDDAAGPNAVALPAQAGVSRTLALRRTTHGTQVAGKIVHINCDLNMTSV